MLVHDSTAAMSGYILMQEFQTLTTFLTCVHHFKTLTSEQMLVHNQQAQLLKSRAKVHEQTFHARCQIVATSTVPNVSGHILAMRAVSNVRASSNGVQCQT